MSRVAVYITVGFFVITWPAILLLAAIWHCRVGCIEHHGTELIELGIGALIVAPVAALSFLSAGRLRAVARASSRVLARRTGSTVAVVLVIGFAALTGLALFMWAYSSAGLLAKVRGLTKVLDSVALALLMSIYTAAVCGGSWMALIGARRLEESAER
ncbi:MAG: hypothetical protein ABR579_02370 [Actinomycetota bacterium]